MLKSSNVADLLVAYKSIRAALLILEDEIIDNLETWQDKVACGFIVQAIVQYKKESGCSAIEAKQFIDNYRKNK